MDHTLHRVATKEREEIKGTTKMARRLSKEGGNHLERESNRGQWKALMEGYILQWMDKALVKGERVGGGGGAAPFLGEANARRPRGLCHARAGWPAGSPMKPL